MTRRVSAYVAALTLIASTALAQAHSHKVKKLEIVHPWCLETNDTAKPVIVSMTIRNAGGRPDRLLSATTSMAAKAELRQAGTEPETEGKVIGSVAIGSRGTVDLKRAGPHILLSGVKKQLGAHDAFPMTLRFERAGKVEVEVQVEEVSILEPARH